RSAQEEAREECFELTSLSSKLAPLLELRETRKSFPDKRTVGDLILPIATVLNVEESPDVVISIAGSSNDIRTLTVIILTGEGTTRAMPSAAVLTRRAHTLFFLLQQSSWPDNSRSRVAEAVVSAFSQDLLHKVENKSAGDKALIEGLTNY
ncbi:hypothetical protein BDN72DRAFT_847684, partial [Pluteus cervinus]